MFNFDFQQVLIAICYLEAALLVWFWMDARHYKRMFNLAHDAFHNLADLFINQLDKQLAEKKSQVEKDK